MLSIIIPTLNAEETLTATLAAINGAAAETEIIVADGGSDDGTIRAAEKSGARVIPATPGRGGQMVAGAAAAGAANGDWFLFLHADTALSAGWEKAVNDFIAAPLSRELAGVFRFRLDDATPAARRLERMVAWRTRALGLPYGDQGLLISRDFYFRLGGFRPMALMEDVEIMRRIGKKRISLLAADAVTSAGRYRQDGYVRRPVKNLFCLGLYFAGLPPRWIERIYR